MTKIYVDIKTMTKQQNRHEFNYNLINIYNKN